MQGIFIVTLDVIMKDLLTIKKMNAYCCILMNIKSSHHQMRFMKGLLLIR